MFTGRVVEVGTVVATSPHLEVKAPSLSDRATVGDSIAVSGVCLTVVSCEDGRLAFTPSAETLHRSVLAEVSPGAAVNLEAALGVGDQLDGHLVQGHVDAVGKVTRVDEEAGGSRRLWIRPPKRFLDDLVAKGSVAVDGVSLTVAELLADRFSVSLIPITMTETTLDGLAAGNRVNLESDVLVKTIREGTAARRGEHVATTIAALPWAGELTGRRGVEKAAAQLADGGGVVVYDPDREGEADVVFAGATLRPEAFVFLLTEVFGHTTVPCDLARLERLEIPRMPGSGDPLGTAYHVSVDLADAGTGVSAHERAATVRRLARPDATPADFRRPGHVFPLAGRPGGLAERQGHTEASLALCEVAGLPTVAAICEVMGLDGHMLVGPAVERFALRHALPMLSMDEIVAHA